MASSSSIILGFSICFLFFSPVLSLTFAFVATPSASTGWIAWAINPTGTGMAGAQSLVAYKDSKGVMTVKTYNISGYNSVKESKLLFDVWDMTADESGGSMRIFGKIKLPADLAKAGKVNQIWQVGPSVDAGMLTKHDFLPANLGAKGTLDLSGAQTGVGTDTGASDLIKKRNIHGILNVVSWGILFPIGVIIASESKGITYTTHRNLGIALFSLCTLQVFALFLRPKKDHKYRFYWNIYHHGIGFSILILGILNVFKGLDILNPEKKWKTAYITVISVLAGIAALMEAITWVLVLKRKSNRSSTKH
ncbi:hypothetical protein LWI28_028939 [Acer negundo]|uniref:Cytochrome b561 and DOMON domain-containing protein n=1 Tax=Acer negundo TaxID=4023 RepID=A0AAD5NTB3_ACENE|nr:hypothetical protein LWI28_028939 [Acer negundo]